MLLMMRSSRLRTEGSESAVRRWAYVRVWGEAAKVTTES